MIPSMLPNTNGIKTCNFSLLTPNLLEIKLIDSSVVKPLQSPYKVEYPPNAVTLILE